MSLLVLRQLLKVTGGACLWLAAANMGLPSVALAQSVPGVSPPPPRSLPGEALPDDRPDDTLPAEPFPVLPPPEDLLPDTPLAPVLPDSPTPGDAAFFVNEIEVVGSTAFSQEDFAEILDRYRGREVSFAELLELRSEITQFYVDRGFVTSGAFIPPQTVEDDIVKVQVIEGELEDIVIRGTHRLSPAYVRSRIGLVASPPLNVDELLEGLQRLQIDPLIETISADLQAGVRPGTSLLVIELTEADSFAVTGDIANRRSPNIGGVERQISVSENNLLGIGDQIVLEYSDTDGSGGVDLSYTVPLSPNNDTLQLRGGFSNSRVIDSVFSVLDISSDSYYADLTYRHPFIESPTEELAAGLTFSYQENQTSLGIDDIGPFPLSPGADDNGITSVTALRFFQEWTQRSPKHVLALRSQFNLGVDWLGATDNDAAPDSEFFSWRGQGQWVQLLGKDALFFLRGDVQIATDAMLSQEQFGVGGQQSVRGYRQDTLLRDSGALLSAELRFPVLRVPEWEGVLQVTPFLDAGTGWNFRGNPPGPDVLVGTGLGLLWQQGDDFSARFDWGIPLVDFDDLGDSFQDNGFYFSVRYTPF
ncbi:MAG: ShlB/FhaC/HecB family hemolysin secretion/activation protein [Cyanobacteria bacterium P01_G01_bin.38]